MKTQLFVALLLLSMTTGSFAANYILTIGSESYDLSLDEETRIKVGEDYVAVKLEQKNILLYATENFSFEHPSQYSPSKSNLGDGISQTAMMTPLGSLVLIQEYLNLDPSNLIDLMVNEITKTEREYGYQIETSDHSTTLADGKVLNGKVVTSKYKGSDIKRYFYTYSTKDSGLFIITQVDYEIDPDADSIIDRAVNSLQIEMQ